MSPYFILPTTTDVKSVLDSLRTRTSVAQLVEAINTIDNGTKIAFIENLMMTPSADWSERPINQRATTIQPIRLSVMIFIPFILNVRAHRPSSETEIPGKYSTVMMNPLEFHEQFSTAQKCRPKMISSLPRLVQRNQDRLWSASFESRREPTSPKHETRPIWNELTFIGDATWRKARPGEITAHVRTEPRKRSPNLLHEHVQPTPSHQHLRLPCTDQPGHPNNLASTDMLKSAMPHPAS